MSEITPHLVMAGPAPAIYPSPVVRAYRGVPLDQAWMAGSSPAMTTASATMTINGSATTSIGRGRNQ